MKARAIFLGAFFLGISASISAETVTNLREDFTQISIHLNADQTYETRMIEKTTLLTPRGIMQGQSTSETFFPDRQKEVLVKAYVKQPDGKIIPVTKANVFTRPSQASQDAPGFSNSLTTTVLFPQVVPGSQTYVEWQETQFKPSEFGFNFMISPDFPAEVDRQDITLNLPVDMALHLAARGGYQIQTTLVNHRKIIHVIFQHKPEQIPENNMVDPLDFNPVFIASTVASWKEIGNIYWAHAKSKTVVTPKIQALAAKIVGSAQGELAAQLLYAWVARNIHYVAVYLGEASGIVPHSAATVLQNGYGDCKDHVVLLQALLGARGIASEPVLVNWGGEYRNLPIPTPAQFNHAMIYLPKYRVIANPTNQFSSFGALDAGLSGKLIVIASDHSQVMMTPGKDPGRNTYSMMNQLLLQPEGAILGENILNFTGNLNDTFRQVVSLSSATTRVANQILSNTPEGGYGNFTSSNPNDVLQNLKVLGKWQSPYAIMMGRTLYFALPTGLDPYPAQSLRQYLTPGLRRYPIIVGAGTFHWQTSLSLPEGTALTHLPAAVDFHNQAGRYMATYQAQGSRLQVTRNLVINQTVYSAKDYESLKALLYQPINDARAVFVAKTAGARCRDAIYRV